MKVLDKLPENITTLLTDSRRVTPSHISRGNAAFVALRTAVGNGHRYVNELYDRGLRTFVVDSVDGLEHFDEATFIVAPDNTLDFLIRTAGKRLKAARTRQIVITGSHKKTTAKELITRALKNSGCRVARSPRTWNSAMGAALSVLDNLAQKPEVIITEVGIDAPGQAERLRPLLRPDIGVITAISDEHDEAFPSHAEKIAEKIALVKDARHIVCLSDDPELTARLNELKHTRVTRAESLEDLVRIVTGRECPAMNFSTLVEVRRIPEDGVLFIDSFTNDLESLPLSLDLAEQRRAGRKMTVLLGHFDGDRDEARRLVEERGGETLFFDSKDDDFIKSLHRRDFAHRLILIKGGTPRIATFFDEARHDTTLQVDLDALVHNFNTYRRLLPPETGIIAMVKADAYGLGALEVAKTLQSHGAAYLAVAVVDEGVALRKAGITMPIIVLNPITNRFEDLVEYNLEPAIFSIDELERIRHSLPGLGTHPVPIHIKLDTGMHRVGFDQFEISSLIKALSCANPGVKVATMFTHLATADCPDMDSLTFGQFEKFDSMVRMFRQYDIGGFKQHVLNTAGIERFGRTGRAYDMARAGIGLYGISPLGDDTLGLRTTARLVSTIISLKSYPLGTPVGYGGHGLTTRDAYIATVPVGYADGIDRRLGNGRASFVVNGISCPTVGNICMDLLMIDVTDAVKADNRQTDVGTEVEIFGPQNPITALAKCLDTIPYEVLTSVSPRVRRTYHQR